MKDFKNYMTPFHERYKKYYPALFFLSGFIFDLLTLGRIDDPMNIISFSVYLILSGLILWGELRSWPWQKWSDEKWPRRCFLYTDEIFSFFQGALLSGFTIFYFKSTSLSSGLIFLLFMCSLLLLNEMDSFRKLGTLVKSLLFKLSLVSFILAYFPQLIGHAGSWVFLLALLISSLIIIGLYILLNKKELDPDKKRDIKNQTKKEFLYPGISIISLFLILYILKIIPPIPLSLQDAGVYHNIQRTPPTYTLSTHRPWWKVWQKADEEFYYTEGEKVYVFVSIFAPRGFQDKVYLKWLKKIDGQWRVSDRIALLIKGGREKGFRGYAYKQNIGPGDWKVHVETSAGLEIGRLYFEVYQAPESYSPTVTTYEF